MFPQIQCPVCHLFLLQGMTLEAHLETHPKESVISALASLTMSRAPVASTSVAMQPHMMGMVKHQGAPMGQSQNYIEMPQGNVMIVNSRSTQLIRRRTTHQPIEAASQPYVATLLPTQVVSSAVQPTTSWPCAVMTVKKQDSYNSYFPGEDMMHLAEEEDPYYETQDSAIENQEECEVQCEEEAPLENTEDDVQIIEPDTVKVPEMKTDEKVSKSTGFRVLSDVKLSPKDNLKMQDIIYQQSKVRESPISAKKGATDLIRNSDGTEDDNSKRNEGVRVAKTSVIRMVTSASAPLPMVPVIKIEDDTEEQQKPIEEDKKQETLPTSSSNFSPVAPRKYLAKAPKKLVVKFKNPIVIHDTPDEVKIEPAQEVEINKIPQNVPSTSKAGQEVVAQESIDVDEEEVKSEDGTVKEDVQERQENDQESEESHRKEEDVSNSVDLTANTCQEDSTMKEEDKDESVHEADNVIVLEDNEAVPEVPNNDAEMKETYTVMEIPIETSEVVSSQENVKTEEGTQPIEIHEDQSEVFTIEEVEVEEEKSNKIFPSCSSSSSSSSSAGTSASSSSSSSTSSSAGTSSNRAEFVAPNSQGFFEEAAGPSRFDYGFTEFLGYNESEGEIFSNDRSVRFSPMGIMNEDLSWEQYTQLESNQNSYVDLDTCRTHSMGVSRAPSADSLNIRTDEKMPAKGEISEQESNGDIDGLWNIPVYPNSDAVPRFSSSYDMSVARESWSLSSDQNNHQDASEIATHIIPKFTSLTAENDEDQKSLVPLLGDLDNTSTFKKTTKKLVSKPPGRMLKYPCSMCSRSFRLYRQRKYHLMNEHQEVLAAQKKIKRANCKIKTEPPAATVTTTTEASVSQSEDEKTSNYPTSTFFIDFNLKQLKEKQTFSTEMQNLITAFKTKRFYFCMTCKGQFSRIRDYDKHLSIHPSECYSCGKMFKSWKSLLIHLKRHLGINEYTCRPCNKQFSSRQSLAEHERMHSGENPIKCPLCPRTFRRQSNLLQHRNNHHMKIRPRLKDYLCHCGEVFHTKAKFLWHKETHEKIPKGCPFCRERFIHRNSLSRHIRLAHAEKYIEIKKETVACHICHKHYLKTSIKTHLMIHTEQVNFECSICNKTFSTKWNLKMHKWIHASRSAMPFKCPTCPKAFIRQSDLQDHLNRHKSIKPFTCDYCGCQFGRKYNWLRHTREHITEKQHTCNICGKSFHRAYYLKEHSRSHTNERPYECIICGKTSATKTNHNKHVKIHHARDPLTAEG
ncbi:uncharacterized protein LOC129787268 [Lutzomyia longipalpis]|uniref:uncharacterized protein LOC129787268 n=1 Tax=Lutzomyia longipalpis TaxID=7200 RepID=UPI002484571E|nr:uncharacterized protein LOC129787268 [Lutzomyia longipalpis]XP_055678697.1 uncharacterized protein LOC129787268 [Lutzomyia longipalpis]